MAQRKKSEVEFIQDTFCPQVAVLCSYDAEVVCRKNALTFVELVQPFCRYNGEIKISDPSNNLVTISNLRVEIKDINVIPLQPVISKKILDEAVSNSFIMSAQNYVEKHVNNNNYSFVANINTPWFESWREYFIKVGYPDDHEFLKHFLSCIFVVSTGHIDPLDQFQKLIIQQQQTLQNSNRFPKWFFPHINNIYKYFVLLHDVQEGEISKAHQIYENLKNTYGPSNCHLLQINSKSAQPPLNSISSANTSISSTAGSTTAAAEFDPWLQYCKFNDLYNNSLNQLVNQQSATPALPNNDETPTNNDIIDPLSDLNTSSDDIKNDYTDSVNNSSTSSLTTALNNNNNSTKRHGQCLALSDHDRIKTFISEFLQRGLVPYAERTIKILNEQIQSKKSILKSFSIPRRIFGSSSSSLSLTGSKTSASGTVVAVSAAGLTSSNSSSSTGLSSLTSSSTNGLVTITNNFITTNDELHLRRLADLAFMFRLYDLAYTSYHSCKKEFSNYVSSQSNSEQLLNMNFYLAGALEMASIANFMQNFSNDLAPLPSSPSSSSISSLAGSSSSNKSYNTQYIDDSLHLFVNTCKSSYFSTRATLLSTEALKATNSFLKAAQQFYNLSSDDGDIRSALFLEQAAQCYLAQPQPWIRKYAFFMMLAGQKFNKAGQKKHALRVYKHALDIHGNRGWYKAQDYINFEMSRLNFGLKNLNDALEHVQNIIVKTKLAKSKRHDSTHSAHHHHTRQHAQTNMVEFTNEINIVKDFILYSNSLSSNEPSSNRLPLVALPLVDCASIKVNLAPVVEAKLASGKVILKSDEFSDYIQQTPAAKSISESLVDKMSDLSLASQAKQLARDTKPTNEQKEMWQKFEETLYQHTFHNLPILFKPQTQFLDKHTDNKQMPKIVVNEPVAVMLELRNHLKISLVLTDITLLWKFVDQSTVSTSESSSGGEGSKPFEASNETNSSDQSLYSDIIECSTINELNMGAYETFKLRLRFKPKRSHGHIHILGLKYKIGLSSYSSSLPKTTSTIIDDLKSLSGSSLNSFKNLECTTLHGKQLFEIRGPRLNNNLQAMRSVVYDTDNRLNFKVVNKTALLQIEADHLPDSMICNQFERVKLCFVNLSDEMPVGNIKIASNGLSNARLCFYDGNKAKETKTEGSMIVLKKDEFKFKELTSFLQQQAENLADLDKFNAASTAKTYDYSFIYSLDGVVVKPNERYEIEMWIRAPESEGDHKFYFMFFYEDFSSYNTISQTHGSNTKPPLTKRNSVSAHSLKYRVVRHEFSVRTTNCMVPTNTNIINSQTSPNLLINMELTNQQPTTSFELVDSFSVSDIWKASPMSTTSDFILKSLQSTNNLTTAYDQNQLALKSKGLKKNEEILSIVLKALPINNANTSGQTNDTNENVYVFKSLFKSKNSSLNAIENEQKPNDNVLLYFIQSDLRKQFLNITKHTNYLNFNFIWKSRTLDENSETVKYGLMSLKAIHEVKPGMDINADQRSQLSYHQPILENIKLNESLDPRNLIMVTLSYASNIHHDFNKKNICNLDINIQIKNLSLHNSYELVALVKNTRANELDKTYMWLGCNKKFLKLNTSQTKCVRFKLGFMCNGVFEIGKISNDNLLKMNLFEATSITSFDDIKDTSDNISMSNESIIGNAMNGSPAISNLQTQIESTAISIYLKNNLNNKYELFKRLNPFTVCVSSC